jgi:hypothetical protein
MRLPKDRHTGRIEIEPAATRDNSTLAAHGAHPSIHRVTYIAFAECWGSLAKFECLRWLVETTGDKLPI